MLLIFTVFYKGNKFPILIIGSQISKIKIVETLRRDEDDEKKKKKIKEEKYLFFF